MNHYEYFTNVFTLPVAAIVSFKEQVEVLQDLNPSVEILIRLLCVVPSWIEKNVQACKNISFWIWLYYYLEQINSCHTFKQVQQQVIEIITHIASTASKFPKKCVVLCLLGQLFSFPLILHYIFCWSCDLPSFFGLLCFTF